MLRVLLTTLLSALLAFLPQMSLAQTAAHGSVRGTVTGADGGPLPDVRVLLAGPASGVTTTDRRGTYRFDALPPGTYALRFARAGFDGVERTDVAVGTAPAAVDVTMTGSSFSSLQEIGRTSSGAADRNPINTQGSPFTAIPSERFADRGDVQVIEQLNEVPGVITTVSFSAGGNGASLDNPAVPQIRGALSYETESLIDGHPVSVGANGQFSPLLVNPALLQDVEIAKGPTTSATEINYAIGGSVNYRTLEPTRTPVVALDLGSDAYGGVNSSVRATGSTLGHRLDYAFALATAGTSGPLDPLDVAGSQLVFAFGRPPYTIDGQQYVGAPIGAAASNDPAFIGAPGLERFVEPLEICCSPVTTDYDSRGELGKLRLNFSDTTALTVSYLGGQAVGDLTGARLGSLQYPLNFSTFAPAAGYSGSIAPGSPIPFDNQADSDDVGNQQQNLFQAEVRSALGPLTILARAYADFTGNVVASTYPPTGPLAITEDAWGSALLCPLGDTAHGANCETSSGTIVAPALTFFNGQPVTLVTNGAGTFGQTSDHVRGASLELDRPVGDGNASLAYDKSEHDSWEFEDVPSEALDEYLLPPGSSQSFTTLLARLSQTVRPKLSATLSDYQIWYESHFTGDGGTTWSDSVHAFDAPRLALGWRPAGDVALRASLGASIAPPYIALLSAPAGSPLPNANGAATAYTLNENNGQIAPEEAFGYDLGGDWRIDPRLTFSSDIYLTDVRNLFLQATSQQGTYTPSSGANAGNTEPLYVTQTQNLGHARYEGVEESLVSAPPAGLGFVLNFALMRAYAYDVSPSLYATAAGPYTANLGILPGVNFQTSGVGFNGISNGRVPYAQGYGELNYRAGNGSSFLIGMQYYGSNNAYNRPAFTEVSAAARFHLSAACSVVVSGDNLTGAYSNPYTDYFGGVPVLLANRAAGATTGYLGATNGFSLGPPTVHVDLHYTFGKQ